MFYPFFHDTHNIIQHHHSSQHSSITILYCDSVQYAYTTTNFSVLSTKKVPAKQLHNCQCGARERKAMVPVVSDYAIAACNNGMNPLIWIGLGYPGDIAFIHLRNICHVLPISWPQLRRGKQASKIKKSCPWWDNCGTTRLFNHLLSSRQHKVCYPNGCFTCHQLGAAYSHPTTSYHSRSLFDTTWLKPLRRARTHRIRRWCNWWRSSCLASSCLSVWLCLRPLQPLGHCCDHHRVWSISWRCKNILCTGECRYHCSVFVPSVQPLGPRNQGKQKN